MGTATAPVAGELIESSTVTCPDLLHFKPGFGFVLPDAALAHGEESRHSRTLAARLLQGPSWRHNAVSEFESTFHPNQFLVVDSIAEVIALPPDLEQSAADFLDDELLDWDFYLGPPKPLATFTLPARVKFVGPVIPLPFENPRAD